MAGLAVDVPKSQCLLRGRIVKEARGEGTQRLTILRQCDIDRVLAMLSCVASGDVCDIVA
jgi:hypothetical protein